MANSYLLSLLGDREHILHIAKQHWIILARNIVLEIVLILIFLAGTVALAVFYPAYWVLLLALGFILILLPVVSLSRDLLKYANNQFIVTDRRVIHIHGILEKSTAESSLEKVNDVLMTQSALGRIFNFGDVEILTASELGVNKFHQIGDPVAFKNAMLNSKQALEDRDDFPPMTPIRPVENIPELLSQLGQLREKGVISEEEFLSKKAELLSRL